MRKARWLAAPEEGSGKPAVYHCVSRVVDRRFVLGDDEREKFRTFLRMQEKFTGCRVLTYCVMSNHFHLLLEVPPLPEGGLTDEELLQRLGAIHTEAEVAVVAGELAAARASGRDDLAREIHGRFSYRMHNLSEFMKTLLQRFTRWFNRTHQRRGTLWEERFKSVIVESGTAARTVAAYIDLNPVRAGMVADPAEYRWSGYGEALGGGAKGNGGKARAGLVRVCLWDEGGAGPPDARWTEVSRIYRRQMGLALGRRSGRAAVDKSLQRPSLNQAEVLATTGGDNGTVLPDPGMAAMLRCRIRYFTDGAVIGSREFVNEVFDQARQRFPGRRKSGARRVRGAAAPASGVLWSLRDLRVDV